MFLFNFIFFLLTFLGQKHKKLSFICSQITDYLKYFLKQPIIKYVFTFTFSFKNTGQKKHQTAQLSRVQNPVVAQTHQS